MRSLAELEKQSSEINLQIRRLLLNNYSLDDELADKLTVIATVTTLRNQYINIRREIRERFPDSIGWS